MSSPDGTGKPRKGKKKEEERGGGVGFLLLPNLPAHPEVSPWELLWQVVIPQKRAASWWRVFDVQTGKKQGGKLGRKKNWRRRPGERQHEGAEIGRWEKPGKLFVVAFKFDDSLRNCCRTRTVMISKGQRSMKRGEKSNHPFLTHDPPLGFAEKGRRKMLKNRHLFFPLYTCKLDGEKETGWSGEECFGVRVFRVLCSS